MICATCNKIYRPEKNGVYFEEMMPVGREPDAIWVSYKLWVGDRLKCPGCGHEVIAGIPMNPIAEHYQKDYNSIKEKLQPERQVNDCGPMHLGEQSLRELNTQLESLGDIAGKLENSGSLTQLLGEELSTVIRRIRGND